MKTVGKQLQEARLAKNWTPELAARETKIKVDRLRDLEADDYSHFTSPTYARGFVRTYARALGLDEYRILRQLDNKLPDDDSANIVTDTGVAYLPETAMPPRVAHRNYAGLYILVGLGAVVTLAIVFVLFEAYRVGELTRYFGNSQETVAAGTPGATNADGTPVSPAADAPLRARPIDSDTPPPIVEATNETNGTLGTIQVVGETNADLAASPASPVSPRAMPVDPSLLGAAADTNSAPHPVSPRALPVDPSDLTGLPPATPVTSQPVSPTTKAPPRALPVDPSDPAATASAAPGPTTLVAANTPAPAVPHPSSTARQSNSGPVMEPSLPPVAPSTESAPAPTAPPSVAPATATTDSDKRLVLTASQDSFVRVTNLDAPEADKPLYAAVLRSGQSVGFDGRKFSINVGIPAAVDIKLDGVNYGPHSDQEAPETFTVQSHQP
jgi:cytoskeleton protein RodZ